MTPFVLLWQVTLLLLPMQVIIKAWSSLGITLAINLTCLTAMYFFWYKKLPEDPGTVVPDKSDVPG